MFHGYIYMGMKHAQYMNTVAWQESHSVTVSLHWLLHGWTYHGRSLHQQRPFGHLVLPGRMVTRVRFLSTKESNSAFSDSFPRYPIFDYRRVIQTDNYGLWEAAPLSFKQAANDFLCFVFFFKSLEFVHYIVTICCLGVETWPWKKSHK